MPWWYGGGDEKLTNSDGPSPGGRPRGSPKDNFIQVWRGIAVLAVVYFHFNSRVPFEALGSPSRPILEFYSGKLGVMVFFAISGFLITRSLLVSENLASFYAKRLSRIWPLFILAAVSIYLFLQVMHPPIMPEGPYHGRPRIRDLGGTIFFLEDLGFRWIDGAFWSILVELKFYFWIGLLAALWPRQFVAIFASAAAIGGALIILGRLSGIPEARPVSTVLNGLFIAQHAPFFAIGALLAVHRHRDLLTLNILVVACEAGSYIGENPNFEFGRTLQFVLVLAALVAVDAFVLRRRMFLAFGDYSYAWYLFHQLIGLSLVALWTPFTGIDIAIIGAMLTTFTIAVVGSWLAEWRFRRYFYALVFSVLKLFFLNRLLLGDRRAAADGAPIIGFEIPRHSEPSSGGRG